MMCGIYKFKKIKMDSEGNVAIWRFLSENIMLTLLPIKIKNIA